MISPQAQHVCMNESISYDVPWPASGSHRPAWPKYGTYRYLPPQRYLHNLEHGGIVGLYNPCAAKHEILKFKTTITCTVKMWANEKVFRTEKEVANKDILRFVLSPEIKTPTCLVSFTYGPVCIRNI